MRISPCNYFITKFVNFLNKKKKLLYFTDWKQLDLERIYSLQCKDAKIILIHSVIQVNKLKYNNVLTKYEIKLKKTKVQKVPQPTMS